MNKIFMNSKDLEAINKIVQENKIQSFVLVYDNSSGIGYTIDLEYETTINGFNATVRIPVCGQENW
jgi:hypothetical protein